jgi:hypothetical protein
MRLAFGFIIGTAIVVATGCTTEHYLPHRPRAQSWDQENLSNLAYSTTGCPAVYDAPNGELRFCL